MAILILGSSTCVICGQTIERQQAWAAFPPFVSNALDPLAVFDDAVMHEACFAAHPLNHEATLQFAEVKLRNTPQARVCDVCGRVIDDPDDFFTTGLITSNPIDPLYAYNCLHLHQGCIPGWPRRAELRALLQAARDEGRCGGRGIDYILREMSADAPDSA